ncbi:MULTISPECIES: hypothetical protein [unclassified Bradyrhizobium]|uniref:hypothetical protein n=1 Tax=unclassified Bradyrhizobium TaxID=2631580 RepID=UPI00040EE508|nr:MULTISPECIES: hypothetical protein [unclassified Bradyrhizobium]MCP3461766.1 hypothetical protein [Bradyrhizobium sp. CCGUVB23]
MRKFVVFVLASAMFAAGLYIAGVELFLSEAVYFRLLFVGGFLALLGGYLLWTDFLAPALSIRTWED